MYKGSNPAAIRSQQSIASALISLLREKDYEQITIKEIMDKSELSRQTFYQLFASKDEILEYYMDILFKKYLHVCKVEVVNDLCDAAKLFFKFFNENDEFMNMLSSNNKIKILQQKCNEYLQDEHFLKFTHVGIENADNKMFASAFITAGLTNMLDIWFKTGKSLSTDELAELVCVITNTKK